MTAHAWCSLANVSPLSANKSGSLTFARKDHAKYIWSEYALPVDTEEQLLQGFNDHAICSFAGCQTCQQRPEMPCFWTCCMGWAI